MSTLSVKDYERHMEKYLANIAGPEKGTSRSRFTSALTDSDIRNNPNLLSLLATKKWKDITTDEAINKILFMAIENVLEKYQAKASEEMILGIIPTYGHELHVRTVLTTIHNPVQYQNALPTQLDVQAVKNRLMVGITHPIQGMAMFETEFKCDLKGNYANICRAIVKKTEYIPGWDFPDDFRKTLGLGRSPQNEAAAQLHILKKISLKDPTNTAIKGLHTIYSTALQKLRTNTAREYLADNRALINTHLASIKANNNKLISLVNKVCSILHSIFKGKKEDKATFTFFKPAEAAADKIQKSIDKLVPPTTEPRRT